MKIVAVVPVKLNNERLPNKNTKPFSSGKPLISYVLGTLKRVSGISDIYVYCSNDAILPYLQEGVQYKKRVASLDSSTTSMNEILLSFSQEVDADYYVLVHATSPFISVDSIEKGISAVESGEYDSALAVTKMQDFLWVDGKPFNYDLANIPRTQDLNPIFCETSGFYIFSKSLIQNQMRRVGDFPCLVEVSKVEALDIDEFEDFIIADAVSSYLKI